MVIVPDGGDLAPRLVKALEEKALEEKAGASSKGRASMRWVPEVLGIHRLFGLLSEGDEHCAKSGVPKFSRLPRDYCSHIFFTSGSTGLPKGCLSSLEALGTYSRAKNEVHRVHSESRCLVGSTPTFDPFICDLMATWSVGAVVVLAAPSLMLSHLADVIEQESASHLCCTPTLFRTIPREHFSKLGSLEVGVWQTMARFPHDCPGVFTVFHRLCPMTVCCAWRGTNVSTRS